MTFFYYNSSLKVIVAGTKTTDADCSPAQPVAHWGLRKPPEEVLLVSPFQKKLKEIKQVGPKPDK